MNTRIKGSEKIITRYSASTSDSILVTIRKMSKDLPQSHQIAIRLFKRDLKAQYRQSILGLFWALFPPMLTAGLWIFLRSQKVANFGETVIDYPVFVFTGTMLWQIFSGAFNKPLQIITSNKSVIAKINLPIEGLILVGVYDIFFQTCIKIGLLSMIFVFFDLNLTWNLLLFPIGVLALILCGFALGILLVPSGMLYHDVRHFISVGLPVLMYLSPVVYPLNNSGAVGVLMNLNPLSILINTARDMFTGQAVDSYLQYIIVISILIIALLLGLVILKKSLPLIIERTGS